jgi:hypothetical protein
MLQELQHQALSLALAGPVEDGRDGPHRQRVEEAAREDVTVAGVQAVDPPGGVDQKLV